MNLEVIMEWVDFFPLLKKEKNKFEVVLHMAENIYELFPLFPHHIFYPVRLCVVGINLYRKGGVEREESRSSWRSIKCLGH